MTPTLMSILLAAKLTLAAPAVPVTAEAEQGACKATYEIVDTTKAGFDATTSNNGCGNNGQCNRNC